MQTIRVPSVPVRQQIEWLNAHLPDAYVFGDVVLIDPQRWILRIPTIKVRPGFMLAASLTDQPRLVRRLERVPRSQALLVGDVRRFRYLAFDTQAHLYAAEQQWFFYPRLSSLGFWDYRSFVTQLQKNKIKVVCPINNRDYDIFNRHAVDVLQLQLRRICNGPTRDSSILEYFPSFSNHSRCESVKKQHAPTRYAGLGVTISAYPEHQGVALKTRVALDVEVARQIQVRHAR